RVIDWLRFHARPMLFSASLPPPSVAAARAALEVLASEPARVERLQRNARRWRDGVRALGLRTTTVEADTPIVPIVIGDDALGRPVARGLLEEGLYVSVVLRPAVPRDSALLRTSVTAEHSAAQLDEALATLGRVARRLGLIG